MTFGLLRMSAGAPRAISSPWSSTTGRSATKGGASSPADETKRQPATRPEGAAVGGYRARPSGPPKGHIIVVREILGANSHIRNVVDRFAADGYVALAPQFFDRLGPKIELGYTPETIQQGIKHVTAVGFDNALADVQAGVDTLKAMGATNRYLYKVIIQQALLSAVMGYVIGIAVSFFVVEASREGDALILMPPAMAAGVFALAVFMCGAASILSIRKATSIDPAMVFRS